MRGDDQTQAVFRRERQGALCPELSNRKEDPNRSLTDCRKQFREAFFHVPKCREEKADEEGEKEGEDDEKQHRCQKKECSGSQNCQNPACRAKEKGDGARPSEIGEDRLPDAKGASLLD